jgi:mannitol-1-phosphate 5-dehydrogenase
MSERSPQHRVYVGLGFGAIQAGLFLYEAHRSRAFDRLVVADVLPDVVAATRRAAGRFTVNVAHADRIERAEVGPVEIESPLVEADRHRLVEAIAAAQEIGTAVPSVKHYVSDAPGSLHRVLAEGLRRKAGEGGPRAVVYTAENHNHAAEILEEHVLAAVPESQRRAVASRVRFLNTVIGKMSGVVTDEVEMASRSLAPFVPGGGRAFLVEEFNRILVTRIHFAEDGREESFHRGLAVFHERSDLLPFEEAKLYGHNAVHALAAYVARMLDLPRIAELVDVVGAMDFLRAAFLEESGRALIARYAHVDPLFSEAGYRAYADDLLERMVNPFLGDTVERVGRSPERKLGWDDRLIGTMRVALSRGVEPRRFAFGAAAALATMDPGVLEAGAPIRATLEHLWGDAVVASPEKEAVLTRVEAGMIHLRRWRDEGFPPLDWFLGSLP